MRQKKKPPIQKWIQLSDSYNRSTNLKLDFKDSSRLKKIYFSSKFQEGLKEIFASILEKNSKHRVRVLSGSPGLGKSTFALLVAQIISKKHPKNINDLMKKAAQSLKADFNFFKKSKKTKLLPVFINGYEGEIEQVFKSKLKESLSEANVSIKQQSKDTLKFYKNSLEILKTKGYGGIFVIYDEFGKYLEKGVHNPTDLNIQFLQNFAEFCDRSGEKQCHLMLITHLSVSQYAGQLPINVQQEWAKIEGRFQESAFYDKSADDYKMISTVFEKNISETQPDLAEKYKTYIKKYLSGFSEDAFEGFIDLKNIQSTLLNCFPLHPSVLSLLPHLSKKVAQNERTLYTFLTRDENHSLKRFLEERFSHSHEGGNPNKIGKFRSKEYRDQITLLMPYDLYQYFKFLIGKDIGIGGTYKIQLMAEEAFKKIEKKDETSKQIISLMALCSVIKDTHFAPLTEGFIASCFNQLFSKPEIKKSLKFLKAKKVVFFNKNTKQYLLQEGTPVDIDEEISKLKNVTLTGRSLVQVLKRYFKTDFIIPKKYNFDNAITRFYKTEIISVEELKGLVKKKIVDFHREDGCVFYVVPFSHDELTYAKSVIHGIMSPLTVFVLPKQFIECRKDIEELNAVDCLYNNKEILSASPLVKKELDCHKDILLSSINSLLKPLIGYMNLSAYVIYPNPGHSSKGKEASSKEICPSGLGFSSFPRRRESPQNHLQNSSRIGIKEIAHFKELQRYLGDLFEKEYSKYVSFNLEYMNRHSVSGSITLGRKKFVDTLRKHKTNPTDNIAHSVEGRGPDYVILDTMLRLSRFKYNTSTNTYQVSQKSPYSNFFKEYEKILSKYPRGICGDTLLDILVSPPYGFRLGVIPVFIALADLCFKQPVSHYFDEAYVKELDGDHYDLLMKYPKKTSIHYTPIDAKQQKFLDGLAEIFKADNMSIHSVIEAILKWRKSIPESTKLSSVLSQAGRKMLIQIDSSKEPDKLLFNGMPDCFAREAVGVSPGFAQPSTGRLNSHEVRHSRGSRNPYKNTPEISGQISIKIHSKTKHTEIENILLNLKTIKKEIDGIYKKLLLQIKDDLMNFVTFIDKQCLNSSGLSFPSFPLTNESVPRTLSLPRRRESPQNPNRSGINNSLQPIPENKFIKNFQDILSQVKNYPFSSNTSRFIGRVLNFDSSNYKQYFLETIADVLTGSSPRHWDNKGYSKFEFALKRTQTEIELACEIASPHFKGQSVLAFIDKGQNKKTFIKLGAKFDMNKRLKSSADKIKMILDSFDEIDKRKIILAILESVDKKASEQEEYEETHKPEPEINA